MDHTKKTTIYTLNNKTLDRAGVPITKISEALGHSNTLVTMHYLGSMNMEEAKNVNKHLITKSRQVLRQEY